MPKVIAAINMMVDGICDHTTGIPDHELHLHYKKLLDDTGVVLYGRITYELMQFWQRLLESPSIDQSMNEFAHSIDKIKKIIFSKTLESTGWESALLAKHTLVEQIIKLKQQSRKDILIGSRSLINQALNEGLIDEFQLCIHPIIEGNGIALFHRINRKIMLELKNTKVFKSGVIILYYKVH